MRYFMMSPGPASATLVVVPANSICSLGAAIHQAFNNTKKDSGMSNTVVEADYGLISI